MPATPIPIANGFYESDSKPLAAQRCVNWYPNLPQGAALSQETLFGIPGILEIATTGTIAQANRGARVKGGIPYFVNGDGLYRLNRVLDADNVATYGTDRLGTIEQFTPVSMSDNGTQLMILVPGGKGYIYNENAATPFQEITAPGFTANGAPQYVVFLDGYFICSTDSKKWIISGLNDGLVWNALDFSTAESDPDPITAPVVYDNRLFLTGSQTTESFQNRPSATGGFPFIRSGITSDVGCYAPLSLISEHNTMMMIGGGEKATPAIWQWEGGGFVKVSTTAIDNVLAKQQDFVIQRAFAFAYAESGAHFIGFSVGDFTFVRDVVNNRWHERQSRIDMRETRWRVNSLVSAYGVILVGDSQDGRIGVLSKDYLKEYDEDIISYFTTQPFANMGDSIRLPMVEATVESGIATDEVPDPKISLAFSNDGKTWGYERSRSIGKVGEYNKRQIWYRNGRFPRFVIMRFRVSDPIKKVLIKCEAKVA